MIRFDRFTEKAQEVFRDSTDLLEKYKHNQLDVEHIFYTLAAKEGVGQELLKEMGVPIPGLLKDLEMLLTEKPASPRPWGNRSISRPAWRCSSSPPSLRPSVSRTNSSGSSIS
jgi:ATP-dependent Clp protease ATP-binding subunit ClpA